MLNETLHHNERSVHRAVTGSTYNIPNAYGDIVSGSSFPSVGTIPESVTREGTFQSSGKAVRGTDTLFTKLLEGSYLYNGSVIRQIDYIVSDTLLFLKQGFPADVEDDTAVRVCDRQFYKMIYAKSTHATESAIVQGAPLRPTDVVVDGGAPISYDATSGELSFNVHQ